MSEAPRGVRVERFVAAKVVPSIYRGDGTEPGALSVACHIPDAWGAFFASFGVVGAFALTGLVGASTWSLSQLLAVGFSAAGLLALGAALHLLLAALTRSARIDVGERFAVRAVDRHLDLSAEDIVSLEAIEAPEKNDPTAWALVVTDARGARVPVLGHLRIDQAQYVARLAREALGLDGAPRVRVVEADARDEESSPRETSAKARRG